MISNKIYQEHKDETLLDQLNPAGTKTYRIEEIPADQLELSDNEMLVYTAHYHKDLFSTFGTPFVLRIKEGESFSDVKERLREILDISEKELEKIKFAIVVMGRPTYISEEGDVKVSLKDFQSQTHSAGTPQPKPWLGLDHMNKNKKPRFNYFEKAIKILN